MMPRTSYIKGMQDPAFPSPASPASSLGDGDDMASAPALLAGDDDMGMGSGATPPRRLNSMPALPRKSPKLISGRPKVGPKVGMITASTHSDGGPAAASAAPSAVGGRNLTHPPAQTAGSSAAGAPTLQQPPVAGLQAPLGAPISSQPSCSHPLLGGAAQPAGVQSQASQPIPTQPISGVPPQAGVSFPAAGPAVAGGQHLQGQEALWPSAGSTHSSQWAASAAAAAAGLPEWMSAPSTSDPSPSVLPNGTFPSEVGTQSEPPQPAAASAADAHPIPAAAPVVDDPGNQQHEPPNAELAGPGTADGYGDGMLVAPELDYGLSGDDPAAATPAHLRAIGPASSPAENTTDQELANGHPFAESGHPLQQEGHLAGESPTAGILPRLDTPPHPSGMLAAAISRPAAELPPPPPRLGKVDQSARTSPHPHPPPPSPFLEEQPL